MAGIIIRGDLRVTSEYPGLCLWAGVPLKYPGLCWTLLTAVRRVSLFQRHLTVN